MVEAGCATKDTVVSVARSWSAAVAASFRTSNLPVARGGQDGGAIISALEAMNSRMNTSEAAAIVRSRAYEGQIQALLASQNTLQITLASTLKLLERSSLRIGTKILRPPPPPSLSESFRPKENS